MNHDHFLIRRQLALVDGSAGLFESLQANIIEIASKLEEKTTIPAVAEQVNYLRSIQDAGFWQDMRLGLRVLLQVIDKRARVKVYSNFKGESEGIRVGGPIVASP